MRRAVLLVLLAACGRLDLSLPDAAGFTDARDDEGRLVIAVTRDGRVRHAGKDITLDELAAILEEAEDPEVVLRVDADAIWCHVQWALWVATKKTSESVGFVIDKGGEERTLVAHCDTSHPAIRHARYYDYGARVAVHPKEDGAYSVGMRKVAGLRQVRNLIKEISEVAPPAVFAIEPRLKTPAMECLRILNEFHELGEERVLWAVATPHPWVRVQKRLPEPRSNGRLVQWVLATDLRQEDLTPLTLPIVSMAADDKNDDHDDRLIINLDKKGRLLWKGDPISLNDMRKNLSNCKRLYDFKQKRKGKSAYEVAGGQEWSSLFVLLRADKETPWLHVKWILSLLEAERFFKVQFAVSKFADLSWSESDVVALGLIRHDEVPWTYETLDAKLQCFIPTAKPRPDTIFVDVDIETVDLKTVGTEIDKQWKEARGRERPVIGRILAPDNTPFKRVVACLNVFKRVGLQEVDFVGVEGAPREVWDLPALPR